jgi:hypothetical protein
MSQTITISLTEEQAAWLEQVAAQAGVSQREIITEQLETARLAANGKPFLRFAGIIDGPADLSQRQGFSLPATKT